MTAKPGFVKPFLQSEVVMTDLLNTSLLNIEFVWWWMFFLAPLPFLVYLFSPKAESNNALRLPFLPEDSNTKTPSSRLPKALSVIIWLLLVTAMARPVWYGEPVEFQPKHRDLMLVVDLSYSMLSLIHI